MMGQHWLGKMVKLRYLKCYNHQEFIIYKGRESIQCCIVPSNALNFTWRSLAAIDDVSDDISHTHGIGNMCKMRYMSTAL